MEITSSVFKNNELIPKKYTCQGNDINPSLLIKDIPKNAKTLVIIVDDPDAPDPKNPKMTWVHWVVYNIIVDSNSLKIEENSSPGKLGINDSKGTVYTGPCPPIGTHRYFFKAYALDCVLKENDRATKKSVEEQMKGHIIEQAQIIGLYKK